MDDDDTRGRWLPILIAPDDGDLELARRDKAGLEPFRFPCRRKRGVWFNVWAGEPVPIVPSHWRMWRSHHA